MDALGDRRSASRNRTREADTGTDWPVAFGLQARPPASPRGWTRPGTYTIAGERGSGIIGINGAAARLVRAGDLVILIGLRPHGRREAPTEGPHVVFVDAGNHITATGHDPAQATPGTGLLRGDLAAAH